MNIVLQVFLIIEIVAFTIVILHYLTNKKLNLKYSLAWLAAAIGMLILAVFPNKRGLVNEKSTYNNTRLQ